MTKQLKIRPSGHQCELQPELSLLENCLQAGLSLPNSCRNGVCRTCMCRLLSGSVHYKIAWPGLSFDEKRDGWILPCVALADTDLEIESLCTHTRP